MRVEQVDFVSIPARDLARALAFYRDVLGLHRRYAPRRRCGEG